MEYPRSELHTKILMEEDKIKVAQTQAREREREIYNEAIEDAAKIVENIESSNYWAEQIRSLKK